MVSLSTARSRTGASPQAILGLMFPGPVQAEDTTSQRLQPFCSIILREVVEVGAVTEMHAVDHLAVPFTGVSVNLVADRAVS